MNPQTLSNTDYALNMDVFGKSTIKKKYPIYVLKEDPQYP